MSTYREIYPNSLIGGEGIISQISMLESSPWFGVSDQDSMHLEIAFNIYCGNRQLIPSIEILTEEQRVKMLLSYFKDKWQKLWNVYKVEYNMLDAYIVKEQGSNEKTNNRTVTEEYGHNISEHGTNTGTVDSTVTTDSNGTDNIYGFNSVSPSPSDSSVTRDVVDDSETRDLSNTHITTHGGSDERTDRDSETGTYIVSKTGNIGYTTPQDMLKAELELWGEPFFKQVYSDVAKFIMYQVY